MNQQEKIEKCIKINSFISKECNGLLSKDSLEIIGAAIFEILFHLCIEKQDLNKLVDDFSDYMKNCVSIYNEDSDER